MHKAMQFGPVTGTRYGSVVEFSDDGDEPSGK
jgi:hypothetical protein